MTPTTALDFTDPDEPAPDEPKRYGPVDVGMSGVARLGARFGKEMVRRYNRLDLRIEEPIPDTPSLIVTNHGFGGLVDLNVFSMLVALDECGVRCPVTFLVHQVAWTVGVGRFLEPLGAVPAGWDVATDALARGHHVVVFPGGDLESGKAFRDRNRIVFGGRSGFARLAIQEGIPVVPIVTAGAGESLLVLTDGRRLAGAFGLAQHLRYKVLPISLSVPWGVSVGVAGILPYVPLPTKLRTRVLPTMRPARGERGEAFAGRVEATMQRTLDDLVCCRRPVFG